MPEYDREGSKQRVFGPRSIARTWFLSVSLCCSTSTLLFSASRSLRWTPSRTLLRRCVSCFSWFTSSSLVCQSFSKPASINKGGSMTTGYMQHSGRPSVSDRRTFPVLHSTYYWRSSDHFVGKPSAIGQLTRPTQPYILSGSINVLYFDVCHYEQAVAPSGER